MRSTFLIPRGDDQKQKVAAAHLISMLDAVSGFNHVPNTRRARKALAMITLSGVYLPVCLPFGPLNGPEVFQRLMHEIFRARLLKEWFIYLDDLAVATFRAGLRAATTGEEAAAGRGRAAGSGVNRTPDAHFDAMIKRVCVMLLFCVAFVAAASMSCSIQGVSTRALVAFRRYFARALQLVRWSLIASSAVNEPLELIEFGFWYLESACVLLLGFWRLAHEGRGPSASA